MKLDRSPRITPEGEGADVCDILLSMNQGLKTQDQALRKKRSRTRFLWTEELHNKFIAAIFDIGLHYVSLDVIHQLMVRNNHEAGKPPLSLEKTVAHLNALRDFHRGRSYPKGMVRLSSNRLDRCVDVESVVESHMEQMKEFRSQRGERKPIFQPPLAEIVHSSPQRSPNNQVPPKIPLSFSRSVYSDYNRGAARVPYFNILKRNSAELSYPSIEPLLMQQSPFLQNFSALDYRVPALKALRNSEGDRVEYDSFGTFPMEQCTEVPI